MGPHGDTPTLTDEQLKFCYQFTMKDSIRRFIQESRSRFRCILRTSSGYSIHPQILKEMKKYIARDIADALVSRPPIERHSIDQPIFTNEDVQMFIEALNNALTHNKK